MEPQLQRTSYCWKVKRTSRTNSYREQNIDSEILAKPLSIAKWTKEFFSNLQEKTQVHYEQLGTSDLKITIDDKVTELKLPTIRDHSYGQRDWNYMNNHLWLMALISEDESLNLNMVSYPHMEHLLTGYYENNDGFVNIEPITNISNIPLTNMTPMKLEYEVTLKNKQVYKITAVKELELVFNLGNNTYKL
ncbi:MAG: hypothetical protein EZS28_053983, partial [Streblomastix strix]